MSPFISPAMATGSRSCWLRLQQESYRHRCLNKGAIRKLWQCLMVLTHAAGPVLEGLPAPAVPPTPPSDLANGTAMHTPEAPPAAAPADMTPVPPVTGIAAVATPVAGVSPRRPSDGSFCAPEAINGISGDGNDTLSPNKVRLPAVVLKAAIFLCKSAQQPLVVSTLCAQKVPPPVTKVVCPGL